jgi:two-component system sensor histidine kinase/response regulator
MDCASNETKYYQTIFEQSSDTIVANLGHELRTPLSGIIGFSELLERRSFGPLTERQRTYVQNIQVCGWRLHKLIVDIVDLSKIEVGKLPLSREWTSLDPLVEAAIGATQTLADGKRITLNVSLQPDLPKVWLDPVRMQQVFGNLLAVAVKVTPEGGSVGLAAHVDQASVCVSVTGTGSGGEQTQDAGLGLALAKRLLEMHGGHIHVDTDARGARPSKLLSP